MDGNNETTINNHSMVTRSKRKNGEEIYKEEDGDVYESFDKDGNLIDLIDDTDNTDFDNRMFQKELSRLKGSPQRKRRSPVKKKKHRNDKQYKLLDMIIPYIIMDLLKKENKKKKTKKKSQLLPIDLSTLLIGSNGVDNINFKVDDIKGEDNTYTSDSSSEEGELNQSSEEENSEEEIEENSEDEEDYSADDDDDDEDFEEDLEEGSEGEALLDDNDSLISDGSDELYDDLDDQFMDLIDNDINEDIELDYFHELGPSLKEKHLKELKNIKEINSSNVPLRFKILNSNMDIRTKSIAIENIDKLSEMDVSTGEYCKMDKWINGLIRIPFGNYTNLEINNDNTPDEKRDFLLNTYSILDKAIYGHKDAKMHILQVIGKWIKNPVSQGNVLALQGPMGNGKTTLVKEGIAKSINRPFAFIALGGASDSSFFDGHSYTYEGSHWGRIIDILIESKCMNPIIYFDELDKVSDTHKGEEIIHLLTHLTDPSQNNLFQDNYFPGIHIDLSKALFIFSFNDETKVNRILKDRMYVINTKGFKPMDKVMICNNYILPELMDTFIFKSDDIYFTEDSLLYIIEKYTLKEEGVRNLKRCLETIISKINIFSLSNNKEIDDQFPLNFKLKDFKLPFKVTKEIVDILVLTKEDINKPPEHMYM